MDFKKITATLICTLALAVGFGGVSVSAQEMTYEEYKIKLAEYENRTAEARRAMQVCKEAGDKLQADESVLFSGEFWTGNRAIGLGLVDGLGDLRSVMRERYGEKVKLRVVGRRRGWLDKRLGMRNDWADELIGAVESRALWSRYGL